MEILVSIAFFVYIVYEAVSSWKNKGFPVSLSDTYYLWPKWVFPALMTMIGFCLLPTWLDATMNSSLQFLSFLSCTSLIFVGCFPDFRKDKRDYEMHHWFAYIAAAAAVISLIFVLGGWYWFVIWLSINILTDLKGCKKSIIYHLEDAVIMSVFCSIL